MRLDDPDRVAVRAPAGPTPGRLAGGDLHAILAISPRGDLSAEVAQLVEHVTENHGVGSSILPLGTKFTKKIAD
jgi:hypothetical protein